MIDTQRRVVKIFLSYTYQNCCVLYNVRTVTGLYIEFIKVYIYGLDKDTDKTPMIDWRF